MLQRHGRERRAVERHSAQVVTAISKFARTPRRANVQLEAAFVAACWLWPVGQNDNMLINNHSP